MAYTMIFQPLNYDVCKCEYNCQCDYDECQCKYTCQCDYYQDEDLDKESCENNNCDDCDKYCDEYYDEFDNDDDDDYYQQTENNVNIKNAEKKKIYKNAVLNELNDGAKFEVNKLIELIKIYAKNFNDYLFIKKVFKSNNVNKSVKKYIEYSEFIENISELFDDEEDKKNKILDIAKKSKKIIKNEIQFDFDFTYPSSELIKFVHKFFENKQCEDLNIFFKFMDVKKSSLEGFLIYKKTMQQLKNTEHNLKIIKKKYLSDTHIINIMKKLCENENLNYNQKSLLKSVSTIKNFSEETFDE